MSDVLKKLTREASMFPNIHNKTNIIVYINIINDLFRKGFELFEKHKIHESYICFMRCSIIGLECLPKHPEYNIYESRIKNHCKIAINNLTKIKTIIEEKKENLTFNDYLRRYKIREYNVPGDGNCQYHAIVHQLKYYNISDVTHNELRSKVVDFLKTNRDVQMDDGSKGDKVTLMEASGIFNKDEWGKYVFKIKFGDWGDNTTLIAMSALYKVKIRIFSKENYVYTIECPEIWGIKYIKTINIIHISEIHYNSTELL